LFPDLFKIVLNGPCRPRHALSLVYPLVHHSPIPTHPLRVFGIPQWSPNRFPATSSSLCVTIWQRASTTIHWRGSLALPRGFAISFSRLSGVRSSWCRKTVSRGSFGDSQGVCTVTLPCDGNSFGCLVLTWRGSTFLPEVRPDSA
jgi:hypothetical protein